MIMFIKSYVVALISFLAIDALWLGVISKNFYKEQIGHIMKENFNIYAAFVFYALFVAAVIYFVVNPALIKNDVYKALIGGLLFGFITYATYDLTNYATLENWPLKVTIVDMLWGAFITGTVSVITFVVSKYIR